VLFLAFPQRGVGRELERWRRRATVRRAAPGREADHVGAAGNLPRRRYRIVPGGIHVDETPGGDGLGIFVHGDQVGRAALGDRAERFLENGGEPAGLVPGRRIVVHLAFVARGVFLPPLDPLDELFTDLARDGASRKQVLGTVDLRRFGKYRGAAVAHQEIDRGAKRRIGGDAR